MDQADFDTLIELARNEYQARIIANNQLPAIERTWHTRKKDIAHLTQLATTSALPSDEGIINLVYDKVIDERARIDIEPAKQNSMWRHYLNRDTILRRLRNATIALTTAATITGAAVFSFQKSNEYGLEDNLSELARDAHSSEKTVQNLQDRARTMELDTSIEQEFNIKIREANQQIRTASDALRFGSTQEEIGIEVTRKNYTQIKNAVETQLQAHSAYEQAITAAEAVLDLEHNLRLVRTDAEATLHKIETYNSPLPLKDRAIDTHQRIGRQLQQRNLQGARNEANTLYQLYKDAQHIRQVEHRIFGDIENIYQSATADDALVYATELEVRATQAIQQGNREALDHVVQQATYLQRQVDIACTMRVVGISDNPRTGTNDEWGVSVVCASDRPFGYSENEFYFDDTIQDDTIMLEQIPKGRWSFITVPRDVHRTIDRSWGDSRTPSKDVVGYVLEGEMTPRWVQPRRRASTSVESIMQEQRSEPLRPYNQLTRREF